MNPHTLSATSKRLSRISIEWYWNNIQRAILGFYIYTLDIIENKYFCKFPNYLTDRTMKAFDDK